MQAVLISIKPKWCELIASGKKTFELRKNEPRIKTPFKVYIYCTKAKELFSIGGGIYAANDILYRLPSPKGEIKLGDSFELMGGWSGQYDETNFLNGKVIGEFVCDEIAHFTKAFFDEQEPQDTEEIEFMLDQFCLTYSELCAYVGLKDFYGWHISNLVIYDKPRELGEFYTLKKCAACKGGYESSACIYDEECKVPKPITRAPQGWCYVEV